MFVRHAHSFSSRCTRTAACFVQSARNYRKIADLHESKPIGTKTKVQGWVKSLRKMKNVLFVDIGDGSTALKLEMVSPKDKSQSSVDKVCQGLQVGTAVEVLGEVKAKKNGGIELNIEDIAILGHGNLDEGYPIIPRRVHPLEHTRQFLHFRPRTNIFGSLLRIRDAASRSLRDHFHDEGYIEVDTPIVTSCDCEGAGEVFKVTPNSERLVKDMMKKNTSPDAAFFDTKAYLSVSGQLHLEAAARALGDVYTLGPTFRAENSKSRLHLSEFYMLEAESAFVRSLDDILRIIEKMLRDVTKQILDTSMTDIIAINKIQHLLSKVPGADFDGVVTEEAITNTFLSPTPYAVLQYDEAIKVLTGSGELFHDKIAHGSNLAKEHELYLVKYCGHRPVFVVNWPSQLKAFYMKKSPSGEEVSAVDLLVPLVGELCGGSLREDSLEILEEKMKANNLESSMAWYLELRKYGNVPTGGFGMGFERYLQCLLNINNIKDVIPFPRWPHSCQM